jgi:hypothetical protein
MRSSARHVIALGALAAVLTAPSGQAQSGLDRPVDVDFFGKPLVIKKLTATEIGALAAAAHVAMGFESAGGAETLNIPATGKPLRAVLDAIVAADPRYEWRDETGVAVLRPATAWTDKEDFLHRSAAAIRFDDVGVSDALQLVVALFGQDLHPSQRSTLGDTKRFNLDVPPGTVIEALNGIVRAHGALAWGLEPFPPPPAVAPGTVLSPYMASLVSGGTGRAVGIGVGLDHAPRVPEQLERWGRPAPLAGVPALERVVGRKANGEPFILSGAWDVTELSAVTHSAMGLELLPPPEGPLNSGKVTITGMSLREALNALMAIDSRYEWREIDGVLVVRPVLAWTLPDHPLSREVGAARLERATVADARNYLHALLEPGMAFTPERDRGVEVKRVSMTSGGRAPLMALLNTVVRSFGDVCWIYEELNERDTKFFGGRSHQVSLRSPAGDGPGFAFR